MVTQKTLRLLEGWTDPFANNIKFSTVFDLNKCLKQSKLPISLYGGAKCASPSELPSTVLTMHAWKKLKYSHTIKFYIACMKQLRILNKNVWINLNNNYHISHIYIFLFLLLRRSDRGKIVNIANRRTNELTHFSRRCIGTGKNAS
mgnify:CR=1 FL=1